MSRIVFKKITLHILGRFVFIYSLSSDPSEQSLEPSLTQLFGIHGPKHSGSSSSTHLQIPDLHWNWSSPHSTIELKVYTLDYLIGDMFIYLPLVILVGVKNVVMSKGAVGIQYLYGLHFLNFSIFFMARIVSQSHNLFWFHKIRKSLNRITQPQPTSEDHNNARSKQIFGAKIQKV